MPLFHTKPPFNFLGLEKQNYQKAKVVILPVPYEGTVSYGTGTSKGPEAIISASKQVELFDLELKKEISQAVSIFTLPFLEPSVNSVLETLQRIEKAIKQIFKDNKFPLMIGGEHSITWGAVKAFQTKYKNFDDLSLLQLDAHTDLRDEYESSKYSHAAVIRRIKETGLDVTAVGIRSMSQEEAVYIKKKKIKNIFYTPDCPIEKIIQTLKKDVYLTIDLDVLDPSIMPSVGTPEPGGLSWFEVLGLIKAVAQKRNIIGADVVELCPIPGIIAPDFLAAKLIYKIINYLI